MCVCVCVSRESDRPARLSAAFEMNSQMEYEDNEAFDPCTPVCIDLTDGSVSPVRVEPAPLARSETPETEPCSPLARSETPETEASPSPLAPPAPREGVVNFRNLVSRLFAQHRRRLFAMHRYLHEGTTYLRRVARTVKRDRRERRRDVKRRFPLEEDDDTPLYQLIRAQKSLLMGAGSEQYQENAMKREWLLTMQ